MLQICLSELIWFVFLMVTEQLFGVYPQCMLSALFTVFVSCYASWAQATHAYLDSAVSFLLRNTHTYILWKKELVEKSTSTNLINAYSFGQLSSNSELENFISVTFLKQTVSGSVWLAINAETMLIKLMNQAGSQMLISNFLITCQNWWIIIWDF